VLPVQMYLREKPLRQISYVLDTEDVMYRTTPRSRDGKDVAKQRRRERWVRWHQGEAQRKGMSVVPREPDEEPASIPAVGGGEGDDGMQQ
jgi:hypothetical protein